MSQRTNDGILNIAVLIACYNRYDLTYHAIAAAIEGSSRLPGVQITIYLYDDGSSDNSGVRLKNQFPNIVLYLGDGQQYWNGAMRHLITETKMTRDHDAVLFLNDDVRLFDKALEQTVGTYRRLSTSNPCLILIGATCDDDTGATSYTAMRRISRLNPLKVQHLHPDGTLQACDTGNGNFVLVSKDALDRLDNLDPVFRHGIGDVDILYRAKNMGMTLFLLPEYIGTCRRNASPTSRITIGKRLRYVTGPKADIYGFYHFFRRHAAPGLAFVLTAKQVAFFLRGS